MTSDSAGDRDERDEQVRDAEWAWVAKAYREVPAVRPEAVERVVAAAAGAVVAARRRQGRVGEGGALRWAVRVAAVVALVLLGRWLVTVPRRAALTAGSAPRKAAPSAERVPTPAPPLAAVVPPRDSVSVTTPVPGPGSVSSVPPLDVEHQPTAARARQDSAVAPVDRQPPPEPSVEIAGLDDAERTRLLARLDEEGLQSFMTLVRDATRDGLPERPLVDRALAGVARDAPRSVILAAVERRVAALRQARGALGVNATGDELTAGAEALEAGAGAAQLADVWRHFPHGRVAVGLLALAGLVSDGVPAPAAAEALARGVDTGASDATLLAWRAGVTADVARGVPPLAALRARLESLGDETAPGDGAQSQGRNPDPALPRSPVDPPRSP